MSTKKLEQMIRDKQAEVLATIASWGKLEDEDDGTEAVEAEPGSDDSDQ